MCIFDILRKPNNLISSLTMRNSNDYSNEVPQQVKAMENRRHECLVMNWLLLTRLSEFSRLTSVKRQVKHIEQEVIHRSFKIRDPCRIWQDDPSF